MIPKLQETLIEERKNDLSDFTKKSQKDKKFTETDLEDLYTKDQDKLYEINEAPTNTDTKQIKKEENNLPVIQRKRNPFDWIKSKVSNLLKRFSKKENFEYSIDTKSSEKDNFKKEITGNGKYNTGELNKEGLYQHMESQEQQTQKDSINIENHTNPNADGR